MVGGLGSTWGVKPAPRSLRGQPPSGRIPSALPFGEKQLKAGCWREASGPP